MPGAYDEDDEKCFQYFEVAEALYAEALYVPSRH